jgi:hypothetical protein
MPRIFAFCEFSGKIIIAEDSKTTCKLRVAARVSTLSTKWKNYNELSFFTCKLVVTAIGKKSVECAIHKLN